MIRSNGRILKWQHTPNKGDSDEVVRIKRIAYKKWSLMIERLTSEKYLEYVPTYKLCSCSELWKSYDNFYEDFIQIPFHHVKEYHFDKDILFKNNKVYEAGKCSMIPPRINSLIYRPKAYNRDLPHGVTRDFHNENMYIAAVYKNGRNHTVARTTDLYEAFNAYKQAKELIIKEVAIEYKDRISNDVFNALYNWSVEFDD